MFPDVVVGAARRASVARVGICLRFAYVHERDVIQWTVSNTSEHAVRTQNDAVDTFALPCKQVVPGSSPGVGSGIVAGQAPVCPASMAPLRPGFAYGFAYDRVFGR